MLTQDMYLKAAHLYALPSFSSGIEVSLNAISAFSSSFSEQRALLPSGFILILRQLQRQTSSFLSDKFRRLGQSKQSVMGG